MAVGHIAYNSETNHGRKIRRCLELLEEGHEGLNDILDTLALMVDGNGSDAAQFTYMTTKCGFPDNATAKAAYDELQSLRFKLNTNAQVTDVLAALRQAFNKFRQ
jgi:hypothetical protein